MTEILFQPLGNPLAASRPLEKIADIDSRLSRTHYFDGRLLTAEDLERDQVYLDERLREAGKVIGEGVAAGLELSFDFYSGILTLTPGSGITRLGRIVQLDETLTVNVTDSALISQLNGGKYRQFNRGLYAVVLNYTEVATDLAEIFPTDLVSKRGADYASVTEAVQLGLVPLPLPLSQQDDLHSRASLIRTLQDNELVDSLIPGDSLPLGILAIRDDTPLWLDSELLRHPTRQHNDTRAQREDLFRQYRQLFNDVMDYRRSATLSQNFAASEYFSLMPASGPMPKACVDAERGVQSFFPDHFNVHVAPVRMAEVDLLIRESLHLPPLNLNSKDVVDVMVLVPLTNKRFGQYATQLERRTELPERRLKSTDPLRLSLYPRPAPHEIDTDADTWREIFAVSEQENIVYVRRPARAAETRVSGIVIADGFSDPVGSPPVDDYVPPVDIDGPGYDDGEAFLNYFNLWSVVEYRQPKGEREFEAYQKLTENYGRKAETVQWILLLLIRISPWFDQILWRTLLLSAEREMLDKVSSELFANDDGHPYNTGKILYGLLKDAGADDALMEDVKQLTEKVTPV